MSYGANVVVGMGEEDYRERVAKLIASRAAEWVAAGDMSRREAIQAAVESIRQDVEEDNDVTGTLAVLNDRPAVSKTMPPYQTASIRDELMDAARAAAESF